MDWLSSAAHASLLRCRARLLQFGSRYRKGNFLEAFNEPPAGRTRRRFRLPYGRHGEGQPAGRHVFNRQYRKSILIEIPLNDMKGHSAPAETVQEKMMLGEQIS